MRPIWREGNCPGAAALFAGVAFYRSGHCLAPGWRSRRLAAGHGVSLLDVAIGALAALPGCASVIAGATTPAQVTGNAGADWIPAPADLAELDKIVPCRAGILTGARPGPAGDAAQLPATAASYSARTARPNRAE